MKKRESKYVKIDIVNKIIYRYNDAVYANGLDIVLEDPLISVDKEGLHISGKEWKWQFFNKGAWVEDIKDDPMYEEILPEYLMYKPRTIRDFFDGTQRPYALGWCRLVRTDHVEYHFGQWAII